MAHHEDLAEADRLITDCMDRIARQRKVITTRYEQGLSRVEATGIRGKPARLEASAIHRSSAQTAQPS